MIRNLKVLGLALVAVLAMSALVASAASAANATLSTTSGGAVKLSATQTTTHVFTLTDHPVGEGFANTTCKKATFTQVGASTANGATEATVHPVYEECTSFGLASTINTTGCNYTITNGETIGATGTWAGTVDLTCETTAGGVQDKIEINAGGGLCKLEVKGDPAQKLSKLTATNGTGTGTAMDIILHAEVTGIAYTVTTDGIGCPLKEKGSFTKGDYTGTTTVTGTNPEGGAAVGITLDD